MRLFKGVTDENDINGFHNIGLGANWYGEGGEPGTGRKQEDPGLAKDGNTGHV